MGKKHKTEIKKLFKNKYFYIILILLIFAYILGNYSEKYLYLKTLKSQSDKLDNDLILNKIPIYNISFIYDWGILLSILFFVIFIYKKKNYTKIPTYLLGLSLLMILRSIFIFLNPIVGPSDVTDCTTFHSFSKYQLGSFFSGHTSSAFLLFLFSDGYYKFIQLLFALIIIVSLFFSDGHYSMDILGGIIISYAVFKFVQNGK